MKIKLNNVRLSYPSLFEATDYEGDGVFKFRATFLIPKGSPLDKEIQAAVATVAKEAWGEKYQSILDSIKHNPNKAGYRDGDTKPDSDGYAGNMFIVASNKSRPLVIDKDKTPLVAADGRPYSGCYVNATINIFAYENKGKGISASLGGVQFFKDGDAFSGGGVATADEFDDISEGADADQLI